MITPIIGLEVHLELKTKSKMFCGCDANHFQVEANTHTCPVCLGLPGALPVPNQTALDYCATIGLALGCTVQKHSFFERKNYFYPDLPKGYQISQYQQPLTIKGKFGNVRINRVHMEEDTAKSVHQNAATLIDFNRSGVPLVEIVSEPDITSAQQAKQYLLDLQRLIRYLGVSDADIEKGSMRCEPTVNVKIDGRPTALVEIKNIASLSAVESAINYEIERQTEEPDFSGSKTTRGWDADRQITFLQREKEGSSDYRYFPEPDIPPLEFSDDHIAKLKTDLPELPEAKIKRYLDLGLSDYDANLIAADNLYSQGFDQFIKKLHPKDIKPIANLYTGALKEYLNQSDQDLDLSRLNPDYAVTIAQMLSNGQISATTAKIIMVDSYQTQTDPQKIAQDKNLIQVSDTGKIEDIVKKVLEEHPNAKADYQKNPNSLGFLVGQVMKASAGSANPQLARQILLKLLK